MRPCSLSHLSDGSIERGLTERVAGERAATTEQLLYLAEFDGRRLYLPKAYPSMFAYCVQALRFSEDEAYRRIRAARAARRFPVIFDLVSEGRLHLTAVVLLAPYLTQDNARDLLLAGVHRTKAEILQLLAERFPQPDLPSRVEPLPPLPATGQLVPEPVGAPRAPATGQLVPEPVVSAIPGPAELLSAPVLEEPNVPASQPQTPPARVVPRSPGRYAIQLTVGRSTHDKLRRAQELLRHRVPDGDLGDVLDRALDALIERLERRKFAATDPPRTPHAPRPAVAGANPRHIPAAVKRAVWRRDRGRCTFVGESGHRCEERGRLEFDHEIPIARGGRSTAGNLRLRCRAHNQFEAERAYGGEFMRRKREAARLAPPGITGTRTARTRRSGGPGRPGTRSTAA